MTTQVKHSGGLVDAVIELGFDNVKYFEGPITGAASGFTIDPPARRIIVLNKDDTSDVFLRINDSPATTSARMNEMGGRRNSTHGSQRYFLRAISARFSPTSTLKISRSLITVFR